MSRRVESDWLGERKRIMIDVNKIAVEQIITDEEEEEEEEERRGENWTFSFWDWAAALSAAMTSSRNAATRQ